MIYIYKKFIFITFLTALDAMHLQELKINVDLEIDMTLHMIKERRNEQKCFFFL